MRDESAPWSGQKIDVQIDPVYLPSSEDRAALCQVATVLLEDTLVPLLVYLWRDERNMFLRRQRSVVKFGNYFPLSQQEEIIELNIDFLYFLHSIHVRNNTFFSNNPCWAKLHPSDFDFVQ